MHTLNPRKHVDVRITTGIYPEPERLDALTPFRATPRKALEHIREFRLAVGDCDVFGYVTLHDGERMSLGEFQDSVRLLEIG